MSLELVYSSLQNICSIIEKQKKSSFDLLSDQLDSIMSSFYEVHSSYKTSFQRYYEILENDKEQFYENSELVKEIRKDAVFSKDILANLQVQLTYNEGNRMFCHLINSINDYLGGCMYEYYEQLGNLDLARHYVEWKRSGGKELFSRNAIRENMYTQLIIYIMYPDVYDSPDINFRNVLDFAFNKQQDAYIRVVSCFNSIKNRGQNNA